MLQLKAITEDNFSQCLGLQANAAAAEYVDPVVYSLAEAWLNGNESIPLAIYEDDLLVGFVSMNVGDNNPLIINFLIDRAYQNKGYGTAAAKACICILRDKYNASKISVPVHMDNTRAQNFWSKLNFKPSDTVENGYVFMRLFLTK